jgi:DNA-binding NarL/FixJ family response regulator
LTWQVTLGTLLLRPAQQNNKLVRPRRKREPLLSPPSLYLWKRLRQTAVHVREFLSGSFTATCHSSASSRGHLSWRNTQIAVIVVDQNAGLVRDMELLISRAIGGMVFGFSDYPAARAALKRGHAQALVVDAGASDAPGAALIQEMCDTQDPKRLFVLATTTASWEQTEPQALYAAGADMVVTKPSDPAVLLTALAKGMALSSSPDVVLLCAGTESQSLDYKDRLSLTCADERASIAKDVIAMANYGGGKILIGVAEPVRGAFELVGIPIEHLEEYETTVINKAIRDFMSPHIAVKVRRIIYERRTFVVLDVPAADTIILAARENQNAKLFQGRIYSRSSAAESAEVRTETEMRTIIERVVTARVARDG